MIFIPSPDGSDLKRLTSDPGNEASVYGRPMVNDCFQQRQNWFKDEAAIHPYNPQPYGEICVMHADGSDVRVLTDNQFEEATPAWMPLVKGNKK
jgi:hypothetical protein